MQGHSQFDYIIIGNGLAGLQLALAMAHNNFFSKKTIALIDPSPKNKNDRTWSFWETEPSAWNAITFKSWSNAQILTANHTIALNLSPYSYKSIRAIDFYDYATSELARYPNFTFFIEEVIAVKEEPSVLVQTNNGHYAATHVFDSRIPIDFFINNTSLKINQHFKGIVIKTKKKIFNDRSFTMMDYRLKDGPKTTFMYVLPFSQTEALIEFTYFTEQLVSDDVYDRFITKYITTYLNLTDYDIVETEQGNIPMTNFPFYRYNTQNITKIGTAGGWVKPSTGYSFKHTEKKVSKIIANIVAGNSPSKQLFKKKYRFYDKIFLSVLKNNNDKGEWIFKQFYSKNSPNTMFRFLDENSTFWEELQIMWSLLSWQFIKAFFKTL